MGVSPMNHCIFAGGLLPLAWYSDLSSGLHLAVCCTLGYLTGYLDSLPFHQEIPLLQYLDGLGAH